jgi:hypothetical protein
MRTLYNLAANRDNAVKIVKLGGIGCITTAMRNFVKLSFNRPGSSSGTAAETPDRSNSTQGRAVEMKEAPVGVPALPAGWIMAWSKTQQKPYYVSPTGECTWIKPVFDARPPPPPLQRPTSPPLPPPETGKEEEERRIMELVEVQHWACRAIANLAFEPDNKAKIVAAGGIECIVDAMKRYPAVSRLQIWACYAMTNMSSDPVTEASIAAAGGIECIIAAMNTCRDHLRDPLVYELQLAACKALINLSVQPENKVKIATAVGIDCIVTAMRHALAPMTFAYSDGSLKPGYFQTQVDQEVCGCRAIVNLLTPSNPDIEARLIASDAIPCIITAMHIHATYAQLQLWACTALAMLAINPESRAKITAAGGIECIIAAIHRQKKEGVLVEEVEHGVALCTKASVAPCGPQNEVRFRADQALDLLKEGSDDNKAKIAALLVCLCLSLCVCLCVCGGGLVGWSTDRKY